MFEQNEKQWKIIDLINCSTNYLKEKGVDNPRTSTEILLSYILNTKIQELTGLVIYLKVGKLKMSEELLKSINKVFIQPNLMKIRVSS